MSTSKPWNKSYSREINASSQDIWKTFSDVSNWKLWNPGVKSVQMDGVFIAGSWFSMELPDGEIIRSKLIDVNAPQRFIDETLLGETLIQVEHRIETKSDNQCLVIYTVNVQGPDAQVIGEAVSADFPDVLVGLDKYMESVTNL